MDGILPEGANINRPPGFNGQHYSFWKNKFRIFVMATEYGLWRVFQTGDYVPTTVEDGLRVPKPEEDYTENDRKTVMLNSKAILMLQSALSQQEYFRICNLPTAKEMWDALEVVYEGTDGVKENRINTLTTEYDLIQMKSGESIGEFQYRFTHLINQLAALGKSYEQSTQVRKILNVLSKEWEAKVTAIEEARGESMRSVAALFGSLTEYESKLKHKKGVEQITSGMKNKGIALKADKEIDSKPDEEEDDDDDEDNDELGMFVRRFRKFYRKNQGFRDRSKGSSSYNNKREPKDKDQIICYECEKPGHYKSECPQLKDKDKDAKKKKFKNFKKKAYVSGIWGDDSSEEESGNDEENANICLVAEEDCQETENEVNDSPPTYDELFEEYSVIHSEFMNLAEKYRVLKNRNAMLEQRFSSECADCIDLEKRNLQLTKSLEKFTKGSEMLNVILKSQRLVNDRSGIGYNPVFDKKKGKKKSGGKPYLNFFQKSVHSSNPFAHCNYCNRKGHSTSSCFHKRDRKDKPIGNYQWVPKGTYVPQGKAHTNLKGPKKRWVPKNAN